FFCSRPHAHPHLHPFPTRRSSDLAPVTEWKKKQGNIYEAEFTIDRKEITVMFDATGKWLETETAIDPASVPQAIMNTIATQFKKDRKSTRLNSSHLVISYAVFCLK